MHQKDGQSKWSMLNTHLLNKVTTEEHSWTPRRTGYTDDELVSPGLTDDDTDDEVSSTVVHSMLMVAG